MNVLIDHFSIVMIVGVIAVVAISQLNRLVGSILGIVLWISLAGLGTMVYDGGGGIGIAGIRFSREVFYGICGLFVVTNLATAIKSKGRRSSDDPDPGNT